MSNEVFPIDLSKFKPLSIDPWIVKKLSVKQKEDLTANIKLCRTAIAFFTAIGKDSGYGGHTGGAFDTVPEVMILDSFFRARPDKFVPIFFDEAGHRVATQYLMSVLYGHMEPEALLHYRVGHKKLPGHPELGMTPGVKFSSGRLGHMWPMLNGVAMANKEKIVCCLGSDGSQQEGNSAEAARLSVAQNLNVKMIIDDNDVTIAGHPSEYMKGYSVKSTLQGHGLWVTEVNGEELDDLYANIRRGILCEGPCAVIIKRPMAPGIPGIEGTHHAHDALTGQQAIPYLEASNCNKAIEYLKTKVKKTSDPQKDYLGSSGKRDSNRKAFGKIVSNILLRLSPEDRQSKVMVIDCDLEGSTGLNTIHKSVPDVYTMGGIMERGNLLTAAGFGMQPGKQGIYSTFAAFLEMCCSEITMARLNNCNLLCHYSHSGVDDMADNTCHFGLNIFFADNGLLNQYDTKLYFPADLDQLTAVTEKIFWQPGLRFIFTTRSKVPAILDESGKPFYGKGYSFTPGKDEIVRKGKGYIVSFGDALYRCLDAVERLKNEGHEVGLINKPTLNVVDEEMMKQIGHSSFVLVVESISIKNGLGVRFGSWLLERGYCPKYAHIGSHQEGSGGLWEHAYHQGFDSTSVYNKVKQMITTIAKL